VDEEEAKMEEKSMEKIEEKAEEKVDEKSAEAENIQAHSANQTSLELPFPDPTRSKSVDVEAKNTPNPSPSIEFNPPPDKDQPIHETSMKSMKSEHKSQEISKPEIIIPQGSSPTIDTKVAMVDLPPTPSKEKGVSSSDPKVEPIIKYDESENTTEIDKILKETEELLLMFNVPLSSDKSRQIRQELIDHINDNMEQIIEIFSITEGPPKATEHSLVRIAEIGKKYLEGSLQAKLLRAVLEEYRKVQELKLKQLEQEKVSLQNTQTVSEKFDVLQALLAVFPEDLLREIEELKETGKLPRDSELGTGIGTVADSVISESPPPEKVSKSSRRSSQSSSAQKPKWSPYPNKPGRQPRGTPIQKTTQNQYKFKNATYDPRHRATPKAGEIAKKGRTLIGQPKKGHKHQESIKSVKNTEEDAWIGMKSAELENDELWEKEFHA